MNLFRRKSITALQTEALTDNSLHRALGPLNLVLLGIGCIIGTGIFVLTGTAAAQNAGPAVVLSFALAGIVSAFAALCYSEFASLVPMSGSAYTYGYATLGELFAWIIGWDLALEYAVGAIAVSVGWSGYMVSFLRDFGIQIPPELSAARGIHLIDLPAALAATLKMKVGWTVFGGELANQIKAAGTDPASLHQVTAIFNLPAVIIVAIVTILLVVGIKESAGFNNLIVFLKIAVVLLFIVGAAKAINPANWHPFIPANTGKWGDFGWSGVMRGASLVFFAYIGFDAVSTAAQEAKNPRRDVPTGIIGSLLVCTVLYILVSGIATGVVPYRLLDVPEPIALAADHANMGWMARIIKLGAIAGLSSVILVMMLGQTRVFWSMSRDGLLPPLISRVHPRFKTPWLITIITGVVVAFFGAVLPVRDAGNLCNIGTLLAFVIVSVGVLVLRIREPELQRKFKVPAIWFVAPMGALSAFALMLYLPLMTWLRLLIWFLIGMIIYLAYGHRHSKLHHGLMGKATGPQ
jgi:basic amino acid/polyamine antiporter, APA family